MTPEEAIELLKGMQSPLEDYAELVGAPAFAYGHKYVYPDPQDYAIEEAIEALKEIQQYREIGTVEECREAVEKQKTKTPIKSDLDIEESVIQFYECPNCGDILCDMPGNRDKYCGECGQAIHWSDE